MFDMAQDKTPSAPKDDATPADEPLFDPGPGKHVLFFGDPMCSWCWGFSPELKDLRQHLGEAASLHIVMGGLRPYANEAWDDKMRGEIHHHWKDVHERTRQPFDFSRFEDHGFVYDTEPASRALVCVRALAANRSHAMYASLLRAFYAEGKDTTDPRVLTELAVHQKVDRTAFSHLFASQRARQLVEFDFARTRAFGVSGFPSIVCADDGQYGFLTVGYRPFNQLVPMLDEWLNA